MKAVNDIIAVAAPALKSSIFAEEYIAGVGAINIALIV